MTESPRSASTLSLSARLAGGLVVLLVVGGVVLSLATFAYGRAAAREAFDRLLVGAASSIAASVSVIEGAAVVDLPVSAFDLLALAPEDRIAYQVRGVDGAVLTGYADLPQPPPSRLVTSGPVYYDAAFTGEPARFIRLTRRFAERDLSGTIEVIVGQTLRERNALAEDIALNALMGLAIGGAAVVLLAVLVVRSALRPLDELALALAGRDPQDLTAISTAVPREVASLVGAVNGFMARLDRQFDAMRNLISDSAHQLRTPVAALRAQADLATQETDPDRRNRLIGRIHDRSVSLGRLLDQMLSRALVIHRIDSARREAVDLRDIALDIVESGDHQLIAPGAEVRLEIGEAPVIVQGDPLSLGEAAKNLFRNALAHGRAPIVLGADVQGAQARLWVQDAGPGPSAAVRTQFGGRFVRSAAADGRSAGLGLSIADSVARAFGGHLALEDRAEGFRVVIILPRSGER
ncbi:sensor histidine kinase N-terminal domain-containing protein [Sinirhodobacter sp. WL0062]|uniref:histidine kinase n=1 Tax=Rhodobacter flavimaris TaxID=2907145 RepID=A0ABS8YZQ2_9RHOB|nr:sensor histidine kinase [Sinirhodobacter sp. WL0062]MCE5973984.1 sensor histidine kinase N-terminal domain-containing protein [Sinirhodobacter sp. WL0062]